MRSLSATCLAIAIADRNGTLRLLDRVGPVGPYVSIQDEKGVIEVALSRAEADQRIADLRRRIAD